MDGLISVNEARAYAREHWPSPVVRRPLEALLDNCPRVEAQWISVKDRLPEDRDWVLVIGVFDPEGGWCVPHIAEYWNDSWWSDNSEYPYIEACGLHITHWRPLPEPPKE